MCSEETLGLLCGREVSVVECLVKRTVCPARGRPSFIAGDRDARRVKSEQLAGMASYDSARGGGGESFARWLADRARALFTAHVPGRLYIFSLTNRLGSP